MVGVITRASTVAIATSFASPPPMFLSATGTISTARMPMVRSILPRRVMFTSEQHNERPDAQEQEQREGSEGDAEQPRAARPFLHAKGPQVQPRQREHTEITGRREPGLARLELE